LPGRSVCQTISQVLLPAQLPTLGGWRRRGSNSLATGGRNLGSSGIANDGDAWFVPNRACQRRLICLLFHSHASLSMARRPLDADRLKRDRTTSVQQPRRQLPGLQRFEVLRHGCGAAFVLATGFSVQGFHRRKHAACSPQCPLNDPARSDDAETNRAIGPAAVSVVAIRR